MSEMVYLVLLLALAAPALAQSSLARQRASIRRQFSVTHPKAPEPVRFRSCDTPPPSELNAMIGAAARANRVPVNLVREVARQESGFQPCARSSKGAQGLMQLMPATQATLGVSNPFDPAESLMAGARFLKTLLERYDGNLSLALSAYNAGPKRVDAVGHIPPIPETRAYVKSILGRLTE
jgi:soluble lytic murein transglycosylase-like protein